MRSGNAPVGDPRRYDRQRMGITPEALRDATFRIAPLRGYHPDDVDDFLERMAAGLEILAQRVREATEAAVRAEQSTEDEGEVPGEHASMSDLMLASQHAADQSLDQARAQADRVLARAETYARVLLEEAMAASDRTRNGAAMAAEADLQRLRSARDRLRVEAIALEHDVLAAPLPRARPTWPTCLHTVEQRFQPPTH
jgi:DivIVA domain-containing protein